MNRRTRAALLLFLLLWNMWLPAVRAEDENDPRVEHIRQQLEAILDDQAAAMLAETGSPEERADVALAIGAIIEMGLMGDPDPVKAVNYFLFASEIGSAEADCALGGIHMVGAQSRSGIVDQDVTVAVDYYSQAAVGGSVKAMLELGRIFTEGAPGLERDPKKALAYFMDAASRGNPEALARVEPIMEHARQWEEAHPGKDANFPLSQEELVKPELVKADAVRNDHLDKTASHVYVELNRRVSALAARMNQE